MASDFQSFLEDILAPVGGVRFRRMFGGHGIYRDDLMFALIVRVFSSWFGMGRHHRWVAWSYRLTDWLVEPIRRVLPTMGILDLSPLVAWFALSLIRGPLL